MAFFHNCIVLALFVALTFSSLGVGMAARRLMQMQPQPTIPTLPKPTLPPLPPMPNMPKTTLPPLPSMPNLPQPTLPNIPTTLPKPAAFPPLPNMPAMPNVPKMSLLPMPNMPSFPTMPTTLPSIPFLSPPPKASSP